MRTTYLGTSPNISININGSIHIGLIIILDLNPVGITIVPSLYNCSVGELSNVCLNLVSNLETKLVGNQTCHEALLEPIMIKILSNEDEDVLTLGSVQRDVCVCEIPIVNKIHTICHV
jgi:hypothetical protein